MDQKTIITVFNYNNSEYKETKVSSDECVNYKNMPGVTWIDVRGFEDKETVEKLAACYNLHQIDKENLIEQNQRPKIEDHGEYLFVVIKTLVYNEDEDCIDSEAVYMVIGKNHVITFRRGETSDPIMNPVKKRIRAGGSRLRKSGADYLAYRVIDALVDHYFKMMEWFGEQLEILEDEVFERGDKATLMRIQKNRRQMLFMRESIWPLREVLNSMQRGESPLIKKESRIFIKDVYDHTVQIIGTLETFRDTMSSMLEIYLSTVSNKMNEVMKVLTIIATIFIPLTFITGVYGMNFRFMPELYWQYGYLFTWGGMLLLVAAMFVYFKKKHWF